MPTTTHDLKSAPENFRRFLARTRDCELRVNDRNFGLGDSVLLREFKEKPGPSPGVFTGRTITMKVVGLLPVMVPPDPGKVGTQAGVLLTYEMIGTDKTTRKAKRPAPSVFHVGQVFEFPPGDSGEAFRIKVDAIDADGRARSFSPV